MHMDPAGSRQRIITDHVRVPIPMIGQYKLDLWVNSIRDTGTFSLRTSMLYRQWRSYANE